MRSTVVSILVIFVSQAHAKPAKELMWPDKSEGNARLPGEPPMGPGGGWYVTVDGTDEGLIGATALMYAANAGAHGVIDVLLSHGAETFAEI